ncbi:nucleotide exchange factor GrpE [Plantactinospora sonchi]|uniref:Nucleotide exchange factor GrpE n=1 Tax=Plantactinospora sonchi TaxID=1544735 RepID=A0ABU7RNM9_9ACTN
MTPEPRRAADDETTATTTVGAPGDVPTSGHGGTDVSLDLLLGEIRRLQSAFDSKIRYDEVRERFVQSMSDELTAYRENQALLHLRPLLVDLITMYDDLTRVGETPDCPAETAKVLALFRDTVKQVLARSGVEPFTVEDDVLDRGHQQAISVVPTDDPAANRRIAQRLRPGFRWNGKVLRPEWVTVYRYTRTAAPQTTPPQTGTTPPQTSATPHDAGAPDATAARHSGAPDGGTTPAGGTAPPSHTPAPGQADDEGAPS